MFNKILPILRNSKIYFQSTSNFQNFCHFNRSSRIQFSLRRNNNKNISIRKCEFHTTKRLDVPPTFFLLLIRPISKVGFFIFGRFIKFWWKTRNPEEKKITMKWISAHTHKIYYSVFALCTVLFCFYAFRIETNLLTGRSRFLILNEEQRKKLGDYIKDMHLEDNRESILHESHPVYSRLIKIVDNLITANQDLLEITEKNWTLTVLSSEDVNAYVLPGGNIFVCTSLLNMVENDDQLALVLAHEIAHALLEHSIEDLSRSILLDILIAVPMIIISAVYPDMFSILIQLMGGKLIKFFDTLPYSRKHENEADEVGIKLAAKACIDVREAVVFWGIMHQMFDEKIDGTVIPWLSTHPTHENRIKNLCSSIPEAIKLRSTSGCKSVTGRDPIAVFFEQSAKSKNQIPTKEIEFDYPNEAMIDSVFE